RSKPSAVQIESLQAKRFEGRKPLVRPEGLTRHPLLKGGAQLVALCLEKEKMTFKGSLLFGGGLRLGWHRSLSDSLWSKRPPRSRVLRISPWFMTPRLGGCAKFTPPRFIAQRCRHVLKAPRGATAGP